MDKKTANSVLSKLDQAASMLENLSKSGKIDPRLASNIVKEIDTFADKFQVAAFGEKSFRNFQAKVIQRDKDESYMDTFNNPNKVLESDADEPYMHSTGPSFNGKAQKTFDQDMTSTVSDMDNYNVRDLNEMAGGTKKQPSWSRGSAGKSTRQGTEAPAPRRSSKEWGD